MKTGFILLMSCLLLAFTEPGWETNFDKAKEVAAKEHKLILLNFSGSDWCGPCIRLRTEIFASEAFTTFSQANLVLLNADFPRLKKNQLSAAQQQHNDALADKYNNKGIFPLTVLLDAEGKVLKTWEGYPLVKPAEFVEQLKPFADAGK